MSKKGFTVVELIVTFALTMMIAVFLFQIIIVLKNLYVSYGTKTELLNKQSLISYKINDSLTTKELIGITKCGSYCLNFSFIDGTVNRLFIDVDNKIIEYGNYKTSLPQNSYFSDINVFVYISPVFNQDNDDSLLVIDIPIFNDIIKKENFGIRAVYQYNSELTNITKVIFDETDSKYGSIILKGNSELQANNDVKFIEPGFITYDNEGNIINNSTVEVNNPFDSMTLPYKEGKYEITYKLKDNTGNIANTLVRTIEIVSYYYLTYEGEKEKQVDFGTNYDPPKCKIFSSYGNEIKATDLPTSYTYNETNNYDGSKIGTYNHNCTLTKDNVIVDSFDNKIYVK